MIRTDLLVAVHLLLLTACRRAEPDDSRPPDGPTVPAPVDTDTTPPEPEDTAGPREHCFDEPIEFIPGRWENPWQPGEGQFLPFTPGDELPSNNVTLWRYMFDYILTNAHPAVTFEWTLADTRTLQLLSGPELVCMAPRVYDGSCATDPSVGYDWLWTNPTDPDGTRPDVCALHGTPVTLTWGIVDLVDGRTASGSVDLVVNLEEWQFGYYCPPGE